MKQIKSILLPLTLALACAVGFDLSVVPAQGQNLSLIKKSARNAAAGLTVKTVNGKTTVTFKRKKVWSGKTKGKVLARAKTINGKEYAAVFVGRKVVWENVKGAAKRVK